MIDYDDEFQKKMRELRCLNCHGLLMKEYIHRGRIEIKCTNTDPATRKTCGTMNRFVFRDHRDKPGAKIKTGGKPPVNIKAKE